MEPTLLQPGAPIRITIEVEPAPAPPETDPALRAAARRVLGLIEMPSGGTDHLMPGWVYGRRDEVVPALAELRRLAGY